MSQKQKSTSLLNQWLLWLIVLALIARVTVFARQRSFTRFASIDTLAMIEIILVGIGIVFVLLNPKLKRSLHVIRESSSSALLLYYFLCLGSSLWSLHASYTLFRSVEMIAIIMLISLAVSYYEDFYSAERACLMASMITVSFLIFMQLRLNSWHMSLGAFHTNQYSAIAAMAFVYCFGERFNTNKFRKRFLTRLAVIFGFLTLLGTSAASNVAALVGLVIVLLCFRVPKWLFIFFLSIGLSILYISGHIEGFWMDLLFPGKTEADIVTLSGRTHLWDAYFRLIADRPLWGYGFGVISRLGSHFGTISTTNTHNGLLEVLLGTGILGGGFFLFWLVKLSGEILSVLKNNRVGGVGYAGVLTVALVNNMARSLIGGMFDASHAVFLVLLSLFVFHIRIQLRERA